MNLATIWTFLSIFFIFNSSARAEYPFTGRDMLSVLRPYLAHAAEVAGTLDRSGKACQIFTYNSAKRGKLLYLKDMYNEAYASVDIDPTLRGSIETIEERGSVRNIFRIYHPRNGLVQYIELVTHPGFSDDFEIRLGVDEDGKIDSRSCSFRG